MILTPTQAETTPNLFLNIPPILSNSNEVLMTSYAQEIMDEKKFILQDQLGKEETLVQEYFPHFIAAKLAAANHLKGVGNKNFPVAVLYDDWINIHPKIATKDRLHHDFHKYTNIPDPVSRVDYLEAI